MNRTLYTLMLRLASPFLWAWMALRARRAGGHWDIFSRARFGFAERGEAQAGNRDRLWIHAVSLGETRAAQPLIQALLAAGTRILLTHTTPTGRAEGARQFASAIASGQLKQAWLPYDFPGSAWRFFNGYQPRAGILVEREVWPNLLHQARRAEVPMLLVSARFSESALHNTRWLHRALRQAYGSLEMTLAQTKEDAERLVEVGVRDIRVVGNMKFDLALPIGQIDAGRKWRATVGRPIVAIASTREGEDAPFADLIAAMVRGPDPRPGASRTPLYLLIPRHPQRFDAAAAALDARNLAYERRSLTEGGEISPDTLVLLGDTLGEMAFYYAAADVAIIGGGFAPLGGQNLIEACAAGIPVIAGPHMHNFAQATHDAVAAGAALQVSSAAEAMHEAMLLLNDERRRSAMCHAAQAWTTSHAGATCRIVQELAPWLDRRDTTR